MITIYSKDIKTAQGYADDLISIAYHALNALYTAIEDIEARGGCAAAERKRLEALRSNLARLQPASSEGTVIH